ncbi:MAG: helix-turn-helix transcriptional regulator [Bacteroidales bacterium]|jgi:ArsR family transcriptional regulator|nr:helix-turn-helix transcriptional regulator [Bacteroidales bacterium]MBQ4477001.1 helix-turn-helix transcriptional regulator [Bacteroidales bacterium]MBR4453769.1 helix-turn-helix transcriptional regulator [Bacteroidales bacterium]MCR5555904.1 metalloregulator ArsR/SmtB family transcription factor [Bacteroidales bacterium]
MKKVEDKDEMLLRMAEFYKVLSDFTRFKIVYSLLDGEKCVGEIEKEVKMSQTAVSYQLKTLRQAHLVKYVRRGQNIFYSIDDHHVNEIIDITKIHLSE